MIHHQIASDGHYGVSIEFRREGVLAQLMDNMGTQVRVLLTRDEAEHLADLLQVAAMSLGIVKAVHSA